MIYNDPIGRRRNTVDPGDDNENKESAFCFENDQVLDELQQYGQRWKEDEEA
jgi:hypothetical protein